MSPAREFLIQWLHADLRPAEAPPFSELEARFYVMKMLAAAERRGITYHDLYIEVGILEDFMLGELDQSPMRQRR